MAIAFVDAQCERAIILAAAPAVLTPPPAQLQLAEHIENVRLNSPVVEIAQDEQRVIVRTAAGAEFTADRVVIAMPPAIANSIRFSPLLPPLRRQLLQRSFMGSIIKSIALYEKRMPFPRLLSFAFYILFTALIARIYRRQHFGVKWAFRVKSFATRRPARALTRTTRAALCPTDRTPAGFRV